MDTMISATPRLSKTSKELENRPSSTSLLANDQAHQKMAVTPTPQKFSQLADKHQASGLQSLSKLEVKRIDDEHWFSSTSHLPPLSDHLKKGLRKNGKNSSLKFPINEECTSLKFSPSGRLLIGGFADGTVRLFDLTGKFNSKQMAKARKEQKEQQQTSGSSIMLDSKDYQTYGAVAGQIHAKGVHTSLLLTVDVSEDCEWCFAGVLRGSMELLAVDLSQLEKEFDKPDRDRSQNMLDSITLHRFNDAKLRGFDCCVKKKNAEGYLLFTGKAIKNIHIWDFIPNLQDPSEEPGLVQLYDTQTNGNTIQFLSFRRKFDATQNQYSLQALSKSDGQKLRVWDVTTEDLPVGNGQKGTCTSSKLKGRPSRPPYTDVSNSEGAVGIAGDLCICGGSDLYNQMSIVSLEDNHNLPFNHTELALPGTSSATPSRRRATRGDLKCLDAAVTSGFDSNHVLLLLSDGSIWKYTSGDGQQEKTISAALSGSSAETVSQQHAAFGILPLGVHRCIGVGRVGSPGLALAAAAIYSSNKNKGRLIVVPLEDQAHLERKERKGYWGFWRNGTEASVKSTMPPPKIATVSEEISTSISSLAEATPASSVKNLEVDLKQNDPLVRSLYMSHSSKALKSKAKSTPISGQSEPEATKATSNRAQGSSGKRKRRPSSDSTKSMKTTKVVEGANRTPKGVSTSKVQQSNEKVSLHRKFSDEAQKMPYHYDFSTPKNRQAQNNSSGDQMNDLQTPSSNAPHVSPLKITPDTSNLDNAPDKAILQAAETMALLCQVSASDSVSTPSGPTAIKKFNPELTAHDENDDDSLSSASDDDDLLQEDEIKDGWKPPTSGVDNSPVPVKPALVLRSLQERLEYNRKWTQAFKHDYPAHVLTEVNHDSARLVLCQQLWSTVGQLRKSSQTARNEAMSSWQMRAFSLLQWQMLESGGNAVLDEKMIHQHYLAAIVFLK